MDWVGNGTGHPRGVGKLTCTLTREDRVLDLTGWPEKKSSKTVKKWLRYVQNTSFDDVMYHISTSSNSDISDIFCCFLTFSVVSDVFCCFRCFLLFPTLMSAVFVCLLNHANHDLSSQTARRTRLSILSGSLIDSLVVTGTREHARMHEVDTSAANYGTSTSLFVIVEQP